MHGNASEASLQNNEAYLLEVAFFDKIVEDGEVLLARPRGVPLPRWETYENPV